MNALPTCGRKYGKGYNMVLEGSAPNVLVIMAIVKTIIAILGGLITYFSFKAYRRTGESSLAYLTAGFGFVTFGAILGGTVFELLEVELATGVLIEGVFVLIGFFLIAISLRVP